MLKDATRKKVHGTLTHGHQLSFLAKNEVPRRWCESLHSDHQHLSALHAENKQQNFLIKVHSQFSYLRQDELQQNRNLYHRNPFGWLLHLCYQQYPWFQSIFFLVSWAVIYYVPCLYTIYLFDGSFDIPNFFYNIGFSKNDKSCAY